MLRVDYKHCRAVMVGFGWAARFVKKIQYLLYSFLSLYADQQGHVAPSKKPSGARKAGDAKTVCNQLIKHTHVIDVAYYGDDHLHFGTPLKLYKLLNGKHKDGRAPNLCLNHHGLSFEDGRFHVSGNVLPPCLTIFVNVFHQPG
jgi:hypothetical protein